LVPLAQSNVLVAGHQGTVALPDDSGVIRYRELYIDQVFMRHPVFMDKEDELILDKGFQRRVIEGNLIRMFLYAVIKCTLCWLQYTHFICGTKNIPSVV
jgi:hypothetical protein